MTMVKVKELLDNAQVIDSKGETDTIRLWENYKEQASMWRALSLLQIPVTVIALVFALIIWNTRTITLNVPARPLPGIYPVQEVPDTEFQNASTEFVNLIASYQYRTARRQFKKAREMLTEPVLSAFNQEMMVNEINAIEATGRTQMFFVDPMQTQIRRDGKQVFVTFVGEKRKIIAGQEVDPRQAKYEITLTTLPRNSLNPFGIVINNVRVEDMQK